MTQQERQLACGSQPADLLEQLAAGGAEVRTPHQATCPFCQSALAELERWWETVRVLRSEKVSPSPGLVARVMQRVRADLQPWRVELLQERGVTAIPNHVLAAIAYEAARAVTGVVEVRLARPRRLSTPVTGQVDVEVQLTIAFGFSASAIGAAVREAVMRRVQDQTGLTLAAVEIVVADVSGH
ncbi:MAG: Asp23/Gls24 family envelope stress response protein [Chloroflexota bacterium]|nr:Asp23/Gls24 family envelope stress response protein [Chloroflexota bacterium]